MFKNNIENKVKDKVKNKIELLGYEKFSLTDTLECGQCFRWSKEGPGYRGIVEDSDVLVYYEKDKLIIEGAKEDKREFWIKYFDLGTKYNEIRENLSQISPILKSASDFCPGIRILNQEPWETLCSFIISQNNNIPRIKGIISRLCENFGEKISENSFSFPDANIISVLSEKELEIIKSGFRAKYIINAAQMISSGEIDLQLLRLMPIIRAREELKKIKGVGPKVAECVLLYGFHRLEAFPIDVWMNRVMKNYFPDKDSKIFGKYAGIAQQYLFHYTRMRKE